MLTNTVRLQLGVSCSVIKSQSGQCINVTCNREATPSLNAEVLALCAYGSPFHTSGLDPVQRAAAARSGLITESRLTKEDYQSRSVVGGLSSAGSGL